MKLRFLLLLAGSCSPSATPPANAVTIAQADASTPIVDAASPAGPTTLALLEGKACTIGSANRTFSDGMCSCGDFPQCGGAQRPYAKPGDPGQWYCTPDHPDTAQHAGGCPWNAVKDGAACTPKLSCSWGPCGWNQTKGECDGKRWHVKEVRMPPPP